MHVTSLSMPSSTVPATGQAARGGAAATEDRPCVLTGSLVRLEPLSAGHVPALARAAEEDRSAYAWTQVPRAGEVADYVAAQLTRPGLTPFAQVRLSDGAVVGCTAYHNPRTWPDSR